MGGEMTVGDLLEDDDEEAEPDSSNPAASSSRRLPADKAAILARLPRVQYTAQHFSGEPYPEVCPICMEDFGPAADESKKDEIVLTPCLHPFHEHCLSGWLVKHSECPSCRWDVADNGENVRHDTGKIQSPPPVLIPAELAGTTVDLLDDDSQ